MTSRLEAIRRKDQHWDLLALQEYTQNCIPTIWTVQEFCMHFRWVQSLWRKQLSSLMCKTRYPRTHCLKSHLLHQPYKSHQAQTDYTITHGEQADACTPFLLLLTMDYELVHALCLNPAISCTMAPKESLQLHPPALCLEIPTKEEMRNICDNNPELGWCSYLCSFHVCL